jgi:hypothetical protein
MFHLCIGEHDGRITEALVSLIVVLLEGQTAPRLPFLLQLHLDRDDRSGQRRTLQGYSMHRPDAMRP